jgi:hypothetical protein
MDVLLLLLYAAGKTGQPNESIFGRTRLQKEMFFVQRKLKELYQIKGLYQFRPYFHGPFSRELYNDFDWLELEGKTCKEVGRLSDGSAYEIFKLTAKGIDEARAKMQDPELKKIYNVITEIKKNYNKRKVSSLVDEVHTSYPGYWMPEPKTLREEKS